MNNNISLYLCLCSGRRSESFLFFYISSFTSSTSLIQMSHQLAGLFNFVVVVKHVWTTRHCQNCVYVLEFAG